MVLRAMNCLEEIFDSSKVILITSNRFYFISTGRIALSSHLTPVRSLLLESSRVNSTEGIVLRGSPEIKSKGWEAEDTVLND